MDSLIQHVNDAHETIEKHNCKLCDEKFKTSEELSQHTKNHLKLISGHNNLNIQSNIEEPVPNEEKCKICGKGFATNDELNNHIKEHLNMIGGKNNLNIQSKKNQSIQDDESPVQQKDTMEKSNSSENEEEEMSPPNYTCDFCDKTFNQNKNLTLHKKEIHGITIQLDIHINFWNDICQNVIPDIGS